MGSSSLLIVLILIVWVIVLAPLAVGNNKPIRRSGEGYEETRVLHKGGDAPMATRRRPKLTQADIHRHDDADDDYEVVEAVAEEEQVLIDDAPNLRLFKSAQAEDAAQDDNTVDGEVIEHVADEADAESQDEAAPAESEESVETAESAETASVVAAEAGGSTAISVLVQNEEGAEHTAEEAVEEDLYELDETYTSPADLGYATADTVTDADTDTGAEAEVADADGAEDAEDNADAVEAVDAEDAVDADADADTDAEDAAENDVVDEADIAFAASRRGRGGYDPQREQAAKATRQQRRQRTLLGLLAACVITFVAAFVAGGWVWALNIVALGLTAWYMIALRHTVLQERALHQRRLRQLRRARLGVALGDEANSRERVARRYSGSVILDLDDDSPDFDALPVSRFTPPEDDHDRADYRDIRDRFAARAS